MFYFQFVLLRQSVRQAKFCTVNKLIKEAKLLQKKHGTELQQEKYKRKADKLIAEMHALKAIKIDNISKFGILNKRELNDILQDQTTSNNDRVMARIVHHKSLYIKLTQFRKKFPEYQKYLEDKQKKNTKLKNKATTSGKGSLKESNLHTSNEKSKKRVVNFDSENVHSQDDFKDEEIDENNVSETKNKSCKRKKSLNKNNIVPVIEESTKVKEDNISEDRIKTETNVIKPRSITKEATVKRFAELLEEQESIGDEQVPADPICVTTKHPKPVDDFFITEDDHEERQECPIDATTSFTSKYHDYNTGTKAFRSDDQIKMQSTRYAKRDRYFNNTPKYEQSRNNSKKENISRNKKYSNKQLSTMRPEKKASQIDKYNRNNFSDANKKEEDTNLHPSWLAKKKQQELMNQGFQGKRIVFTDD